MDSNAAGSRWTVSRCLPSSTTTTTMLNDVLHEATEDIETCLGEFEEMYEDVLPICRKLTNVMRAVILVIMTAPEHEQIKRAIENIDLTGLEYAIKASMNSDAEPPPKYEFADGDEAPVILRMM